MNPILTRRPGKGNNRIQTRGSSQENYILAKGSDLRNNFTQTRRSSLDNHIQTGRSGQTTGSPVGITNRRWTQHTTMQRVIPADAGSSSPIAGDTLESPQETGLHRRRHRKRETPMYLDRCGHPKECLVEFAGSRISNQSSFTKELSEAVMIVEQSVRASTGRRSYHAVLPELGFRPRELY